MSARNRVKTPFPEDFMKKCADCSARLGGLKGAYMKLKNVLIVVNDIERSRKYYHDLFGLEMILDNNGNMILTEGLVLQDEKIWRAVL